jgi:hypothetical protein
MLCPSCNSQNLSKHLYRKNGARRKTLVFRCEDCAVFSRLPAKLESLISLGANVFAVLMLASSTLYIGELLGGQSSLLLGVPTGLLVLLSMILLGAISLYAKRVKSPASLQVGEALDISGDDLVFPAGS